MSVIESIHSFYQLHQLLLIKPTFSGIQIKPLRGLVCLVTEKSKLQGEIVLIFKYILTLHL